MLEARELSVSYGRHRALDHVSMKVAPGEVCVVLGANGAGKSTLLNTIAGIVKPEDGAVAVDQISLDGTSPNKIVEHGIALVPEGHRIFGDLTVRENLELGAFPKRARGRAEETLEQVFKVFPKLKERQPQIARTMSGGERQMVAIGRAMMSRPDILMLDEPSLGLSPLVTSELFKALQHVGDTGVGILLVEQNARRSLGISDRGYVLENGLVIHEDDAKSLANDPAVQEAYLGAGSREHKRVHALGSVSETSKPAAAVAPAVAVPAAEGSSAAEMLASQATRIQEVFLQAKRQGVPASSLLPAPKTIKEDVPVSSSVSALSRQAADFAKRADTIMAEHIVGRRSGTAPVAKVTEAAEIEAKAAEVTTEPAPRRSDTSDMAAFFAERAEEIQQQHIAAKRRARSGA